MNSVIARVDVYRANGVYGDRFNRRMIVEVVDVKILDDLTCVPLLVWRGSAPEQMNEPSEIVGRPVFPSPTRLSCEEREDALRMAGISMSEADKISRRRWSAQ